VSRGTNVVRDEHASTETLSFRCKCERCRLLRTPKKRRISYYYFIQFYEILRAKALRMTKVERNGKMPIYLPLRMTKVERGGKIPIYLPLRMTLPFTSPHPYPTLSLPTLGCASVYKFTRLVPRLFILHHPGREQ